MKGFVSDIEKLTGECRDFRHELYTGRHLQLVLMSLAQGEEIGEEIHEDCDQLFQAEEGKRALLIDSRRLSIAAGVAIIAPAGARRNVINDGDQPMRLYTLYARPEHRDGAIGATRAKAQSRAEHLSGKTSE